MEDDIIMNPKEIGIELDLIASEYGPVIGFCEHSNKISCSVKGGSKLSEYQLLNKNCTPWFVDSYTHQDEMLAFYDKISVP